MLPYDWLKMNGVAYRDVTVRYMDSIGEMVAAFKAGSIDIASTIEPYGSALLSDVKGSVLLSDGIDIYGPQYTDCVLAVRAGLIDEGPRRVKALIKAMLKAQLIWEQTPRDAHKLLGTYYKTSSKTPRSAARLSRRRSIESTDRFHPEPRQTVIAMGYIKKKPDTDAIHWAISSR